ncbi:hypothetical protein PAHAL_5G131600 [Panicum hallii]|uniref:Uncharacterized protein n=1 Tax=Panicum hallii TaxID=206008 RepID=A0A2S3HR16_9POAL|nr:hypothetical protein PAHAL_5G131600 [Panicum hallii]
MPGAGQAAAPSSGCRCARVICKARYAGLIRRPIWGIRQRGVPVATHRRCLHHPQLDACVSYPLKNHPAMFSTAARSEFFSGDARRAGSLGPTARTSDPGDVPEEGPGFSWIHRVLRCFLYGSTTSSFSSSQ